MKKNFFILAGAIAALTVSSVGCKIYVNAPDSATVSSSSGTTVVGSGKNIVASENMISKTLDVKDVKALEVSSISVVYLQDAETHVEFVAPDNVIEYYRYKETGGKLKVWKGDDKVSVTYQTNKNLPKLIIKAPALTDIDMSGSSSFVTKDLNLGDQKLDLDCSGASVVTIENIVCRKIEADFSGASSFRAASTKAMELDVNCSGASNVVMDAYAESALVDCSGASKVIIKGKAVSADLRCSGASNVDASGFEVVSGKVSASGASSIQSNVANITKKDCSGASSIRNK